MPGSPQAAILWITDVNYNPKVRLANVYFCSGTIMQKNYTNSLLIISLPALQSL
jgi:hypothetical protein